MRRFSILAVFATFTLACTCGGLGDELAEKAGEKAAEEITERALEASSGARDIEMSEGKLKIESDQGTVDISSGTKVPADLPLALPSDFTAASALEMDTPEGKSWHVSGTSKQSPDELAKAFEADLRGRGVKEISKFSAEGTATVSGESDSHTYGITVASGASGSDVAVMIGPKQK